MNTNRNVVDRKERETYFLVAGEIVMQLSEDAPPHSVRLNTVVISKKGTFALQQIAKAQQTLQMQFHKRSDDPSIKILDVVIFGLMKLGEFTAEEFNARPSGLEIQEMLGTNVLSS